MNLVSLEALLVKFLGNSANGKDLDELNQYFGNEEYTGFIKKYLETHFVVLYKMNRADLEETKKELLKEIRRDKKLTLRRNVFQGLKYAAIFVCVLAVSIYMYKGTEDVIDTNIQSKENTITLEHSNGLVEEISETGTLAIKNNDGKLIANQTGNKISFNMKEPSEKIEYNTITVPYGKNITVALSDSTEVTMNAGSRMTFPTFFKKGVGRKVKLSGEAFFKVSHDEAHPFIVGLDSLDVRVLGTTFNVANYTEDSVTEIVLVSGLVELVPNSVGKEAPVLLKPGYKGTFHKKNSKIEMTEVPTGLYTSWVNGYVVFREAPFNNILQKLERYYNITIINPENHLEGQRFNATIDVQKESISQVLEYFSKMHNIQFEVSKDEIIIIKK
ncbi:FecR family protein [Zobellia alginiliquefaciens]|uniref:FecR family protein n=1 Tax=Zobellia alginiliquefaciens TaxID=3032586 RepID=UPI0023E3EC0D|nr:FecR domain-containing protein [Zobellia alginiliquefaciens]